MHEATRYQFEIYWFRALQNMDTKRRDVFLFTVEYTVWGSNKCNIDIKEKLYHLWKTFVIYRNMQFAVDLKKKNAPSIQH